MDSDKDKPTSDVPANGGDEPIPPVEDSSENQPAVEEVEGEKKPVQAQAPPVARGGRVLGTLALVLAIIACVGSVYLWYRFEVQKAHEQEIASVNLLGELKGVSEQARALEKQQDKLASEQEQLNQLIEQKLETSVAALGQQQQELTNSVTKIYNSLDRSIDSWALEEVEQLLRMANHSVSLEGDATNAIIALELADQRLAELGNPELLEVRRLIAEEITQLKAIKQVDLPGIALRLATLVASVNELPLVSEPDRPVVTEGDSDADTPAPDDAWAEAGQALLTDLQNLVRIQNVTEPAKPLLSPEQRYFLVANLRLTLSGAQIAALRIDTGTFKTNLEQAAQWLDEYFETNDPAVQSMLSEIKEISGHNLTSERPKITGSIVELQAIKSRIKSR